MTRVKLTRVLICHNSVLLSARLYGNRDTCHICHFLLSLALEILSSTCIVRIEQSSYQIGTINVVSDLLSKISEVRFDATTAHSVFPKCFCLSSLPLGLYLQLQHYTRLWSKSHATFGACSTPWNTNETVWKALFQNVKEVISHMIW